MIRACVTNENLIFFFFFPLFLKCKKTHEEAQKEEGIYEQVSPQQISPLVILIQDNEVTPLPLSFKAEREVTFLNI